MTLWVDFALIDQIRIEVELADADVRLPSLNLKQTLIVESPLLFVD